MRKLFSSSPVAICFAFISFAAGAIIFVWTTGYFIPEAYLHTCQRAFSLADEEITCALPVALSDVVYLLIAISIVSVTYAIVRQGNKAAELVQCPCISIIAVELVILVGAFSDSYHFEYRDIHFWLYVLVPCIAAAASLCVTWTCFRSGTFRWLWVAALAWLPSGMLLGLSGLASH